jgi:hypothetical protein
VRVITARSTQPGAASITALARGRVCGCAKGSCRRSACCGWHRPSARWMCSHKTLPVTPAMAAGITNWLWVCTEGRSYSYSGLSSHTGEPTSCAISRALWSPPAKACPATAVPSTPQHTAGCSGRSRPHARPAPAADLEPTPIDRPASRSVSSVSSSSPTAPESEITPPQKSLNEDTLQATSPVEQWLGQKKRSLLRGSASNVLRPRAGRMRVHPASPAAAGGRLRATMGNRCESCAEDCPWLARQRPTLPCLETQYHRRCEV